MIDMDFQHHSANDSSLNISSYNHRGFDVDGIEKINARFKCIFCFFLMKEPVQLTACGHRSCRACFEARAAAAPDEKVMCPSDDCHLITDKHNIMSDKAFKRELDIVKIACVYRKDNQCNWEGLVKDYQLHLDEFHIRYNCPECKEVFSSEAILNEHIAKLCPRIFEPCRLCSHSTVYLIRKTDSLNHFLSEKHQDTIIKFLSGEYHIPESYTTHEQNAEDITIDREFYKKVSEKLTNTSIIHKAVSDESKLIDNDFSTHNKRFYTLAQEVNNVRLKILERIPIKQSIQPNQEKLQNEIEKLHEKSNTNECVSTDGTLTWRVDRVSEKIADARSERQTSIISPIFYSSPAGYKMRVRLFLFGDGNARRSHVSLFFILLKGEYDAILKWPFSYKITFCLLDQTTNNRHVIDTFHPDVKSASFQRPKEDANVASGIPKFFQLSLLLQDDNAYVREDTIYIKVIVSLIESSNSLLPFILSLNPAMPAYVQENLINQETIKKQQQ